MAFRALGSVTVLSTGTVSVSGKGNTMEKILPLAANQQFTSVTSLSIYQCSGVFGCIKLTSFLQAFAELHTFRVVAIMSTGTMANPKKWDTKRSDRLPHMAALAALATDKGVALAVRV